MPLSSVKWGASKAINLLLFYKRHSQFQERVALYDHRYIKQKNGLNLAGIKIQFHRLILIIASKTIL